MKINQIISSLHTELLSGQRTHCQPAWANHGKSSFSDPFSRLYWLKSGRGMIFHSGKEMALEPGFLYAIPAFTVTRYLCPEEMDLYWVHFKAQLFGSLEIFKALNLNFCVKLADNEDLECSYNHLLKALHSHDLATHLYADAVLRQLLAKFAGNHTIQHDGHLHQLQRVLPVITYIEQNIDRPISLKELAKVINLQRAYFCDLFSKTMAQSPIDFINNKRIERAQFLLTQTEQNLKEIADQVGFKDVYYFSRLFKKIVGIAPKHYRQQEKMRS